MNVWMDDSMNEWIDEGIDSRFHRTDSTPLTAKSLLLDFVGAGESQL
jgi:hypothetical protein